MTADNPNLPPPPRIKPTKTEDEIQDVCDQLAAMLIKKNQSYGDSALNPVRIFSKSDPIEQLNVRIDDKLSRLVRGDPSAFGENPEWDLLGYLVLKVIAQRRSKAGSHRRYL